MHILSHRGYWKKPEEKNSMEAMKLSFSLGFGVETDVRDYGGELVISHDIPDESAIKFRDFLELYSKYDQNLFLALNIKSDGLQLKLKNILQEYKVTNYFVFDMSVPDGLLYLKQEMKVFTRQSEYERDPSFYKEADGIWVDCFLGDWINENVISGHLNNHKKLCIVSPELHKRKYYDVWDCYRSFSKNDRVFLCTDYPEEAKAFFNL